MITEMLRINYFLWLITKNRDVDDKARDNLSFILDFLGKIDQDHEIDDMKNLVSKSISESKINAEEMGQARKYFGDILDRKIIEYRKKRREYQKKRMEFWME